MYPPSSAEAGAQPLRAPRANRVFRADEKRIRTENTVLDKNNNPYSTFPGFMMPCGSSAALILRISSISSGDL